MAQERVCNSCSGALNDDSVFCPSCGKSVEIPNEVACPSCGEKNAADSRYCDKCGGSVKDLYSPPIQIQVSLPERIEKTNTQSPTSSISTGASSIPVTSRNISPNFLEAIKLGFANYFNFHGRSSRSEFWLFFLFYYIVHVAVILTVVVPFLNSRLDDYQYITSLISVLVPPFFLPYLLVTALQHPESYLRGLLILYVLIFVTPTIAIQIRRLHDINSSAWAFSFALFPIVALILFLFYSKKGTRGTNKYGPDPQLQPHSPMDRIITSR